MKNLPNVLNPIQFRILDGCMDPKRNENMEALLRVIKVWALEVKEIRPLFAPPVQHAGRAEFKSKVSAPG